MIKNIKDPVLTPKFFCSRTLVVELRQRTVISLLQHNSFPRLCNADDAVDGLLRLYFYIKISGATFNSTI